MGIVHRRTDTGSSWRWDGVQVDDYNQDSATKQVLIGPQDGAPNFVLRYFTLPPHGSSGLDEHAHEHGVMVMHGRARVLLGDRYEEISEGDVVFIPGWERHQFQNLSDEPFTFLCIIPPKD